MKVLLVDPWGINNTAEYLNGLIMGLSQATQLSVFTNCLFELKVQSNAEIHRVFFPKSEKMRHGKFRSLLRGVEYVLGYERLIKYLKANREIDIIHFNWLLSYGIDIQYLKKIKAMGKKVVYTAHNVVPHYNLTNKKKEQLNTIYSLCDKIILHGEAIGEEFKEIFPEYMEKVYYQKHGCNIEPNTQYNMEKVPSELVEKVEEFRRLYLYFGKIFYNKGADRLINLWKPEWTSSLLVIAGRTEEEYGQLNELITKTEDCENILFLNEFISDDILNYLIDVSNMILLPYRHASMSGVVFTAADFEKPVLCTNVGALGEYLENGVDSYIVENDDACLGEKLDFIETEVSDEQLAQMGHKLHKNIQDKCDWKNVANQLVNDCYLKI